MGTNKTNFQHKLSLIDRQVLSLCKDFVNDFVNN